MANTVFLRLEGPLQAWGERGRWSVRDTALVPTKSGVIGLVACALGYRTDEQIRPLSQKLKMGVRVDEPGRVIIDYHTIGGGYAYPTLLTAAGKPKKTPKGEPHTELSHRQYLSGASFLVALQTRASEDNDLIEQIAHALQNPVWPIFLGRKSCPPSVPVFDSVTDAPSLEEALSDHPAFTTYHRQPRKQQGKSINLRMVLESDTPAGTRHRDNIHSRQHRIFHPRYTTPAQTESRYIQQEANDVLVQITTQPQ